MTKGVKVTTTLAAKVPGIRISHGIKARVPAGQTWTKVESHTNAGGLVLKKYKNGAGGQKGGTYVSENGTYIKMGGNELKDKIPGTKTSTGIPYEFDNSMWDILENMGRKLNAKDVDFPGG